MAEEIKQVISVEMKTDGFTKGAKKVSSTASTVGKSLQSMSYGVSGIKGTALNFMNRNGSKNGDCRRHDNDCCCRHYSGN